MAMIPLSLCLTLILAYHCLHFTIPLSPLYISVFCKVYFDLSFQNICVLCSLRIVDSIQECCHCNDSAVVVTSVDLINQLLTSVEDLVKGRGISVEQAK